MNLLRLMKANRAMLDGTPRHLRMPFVHREIFVHEFKILMLEDAFEVRCIFQDHQIGIVAIPHIHSLLFLMSETKTRHDLAFLWCTREELF